jgi:hypothetical protein
MHYLKWISVMNTWCIVSSSNTWEGDEIRAVTKYYFKPLFVEPWVDTVDVLQALQPCNSAVLTMLSQNLCLRGLV